MAYLAYLAGFRSFDGNLASYYGSGSATPLIFYHAAFGWGIRRVDAGWGCQAVGVTGG